MAKELLFSGREVTAEEAARIGLLNRLVPCADLRPRTLELAAQIAANDRASVAGVKSLLLQNLGSGLQEQWAAEADFTSSVLRPSAASDAFASFAPARDRSK
jgi:enoyl-CoA hydratase/carnithine racemase